MVSILNLNNSKSSKSNGKNTNFREFKKTSSKQLPIFSKKELSEDEISSKSEEIKEVKEEIFQKKKDRTLPLPKFEKKEASKSRWFLIFSTFNCRKEDKYTESIAIKKPLKPKKDELISLKTFKSKMEENRFF